MSIIQSIILGILQGLGEFLPISSSAHLIIVPWLLGWKEHTLVFDVALHLGTLVAVLVYFWRDFWDLIISGFSKPSTQNGKLFWYIIAASIPGAVFGLLLDNTVETVFRQQYLLIALVLALFGVVLYLVDKYSRNATEISRITFFQAAVIGLSQAFAIFPGISRSGITMTTGLFLGLKRDSAARFSFLLSAPIIFGAGVLKLLENLSHVREEFLTFAVGFVAAALVGYLAIHGLLGYLKKNGFKVFAIYRFALALMIIIVYFSR